MELQWLWVALDALYWLIVYPLILFASWVLALLHWIATPLIYAGHFLVQLASFPIRFIAKFEVSLMTPGRTLVLLICRITDVLYLLRSRSHRWNHLWRHPALPVEVQHPAPRAQSPTSREARSCQRSHSCIVQSIEKEEAKA